MTNEVYAPLYIKGVASLAPGGFGRNALRPYITDI